MLRTASCVLKGGMTRTEIIEQCQTFDLVSVPDGAIPHLWTPRRITYGQMRPTDPNNSWSRWVRDYGIKRWMDEYALDVLMLDIPFDFGDPREACAEIAAAIAPRPIMPNFGDWATWMGRNARCKEWALALGEIARWHFVQVAYKPALHSTENWQTLRHHANLRLSAGKTLVLGIYDPGRQNEMLSALLMASYPMQEPYRERVYWHYNSLLHDQGIIEAQINDYWRLGR